LPIAVRLVLSLPPDPLYRTVTVHDLLGPRLVPLQLSTVFVNALGDPETGDSVIASAPVAAPPEFVSLNVLSAGAVTVP
jgi:hypothetical protein